METDPDRAAVCLKFLETVSTQDLLDLMESPQHWGGVIEEISWAVDAMRGESPGAE